MDKIVARKFFVNVKRKIEWENPVDKYSKTRMIRYFKKDGTTEMVRREKVSKNYFWKFAKPLKYYFIKMRMNTCKVKEKLLESQSVKWQIEEIITHTQTTTENQVTSEKRNSVQDRVNNLNNNIKRMSKK
jgi:hypothetical protein